MENVFLVYIYIPSIPIQCKRQGALEKWIDSATFCVQSFAMVFSRATTLHTCPKKFGNLQLYILVECKRQGAFWKYQQFDSGSSIVSKSAECNSLNLQRVEQCLDVGIKSLQTTSFWLKQKVHYNNMCPFSFHYVVSLDFEWIFWTCVFFTIWFYWVLSEFIEFVFFFSLCDFFINFEWIHWICVSFFITWF